VKRRLEAAIEEKVAGKEVTLSPPQPPSAQIVDLMEALKQSLGAGGDASESKADHEGEGDEAPKKQLG
jgi:Uncharacterized conserved protein